jgi:hypothetical protein
MQPAAVSIAICQNRRLELAAPAILALKSRYPLTRLILKSGYSNLLFRLLESTSSDNYLLSQRRKAFTSVRLQIPALFAPIVAKKPHIPLKGGQLGVSAISGWRSSCAAFRHYIGDEPFSGDINDIQGHRKV